MSVFFCFVFFFFKQKTAYEIRLSLVGSEMCIRDSITLNCVPAVSVVLPDPQISICESCWEEPVTTTPPSEPGRGSRAKKRPRQEEKSGHWPPYTPWGILLSLIHISEPTRLRRISYAVFCLKK